MSNVYDKDGKLVNNPGPGTQRYKDQNATVVDWFDTHPRPVEKVEPVKVEFHATEVPATLPPNSGDTLKVVAPEVPAAPALEAGNTTSNLPQTAVVSE